MSTTVTSANFCSSNNAGDFSNDNQYKFGEMKWQWGSADSTGNIQPWVPQPMSTGINIPWIISDQTYPVDILKIGDLRINSASGMIERWDGTKWEEYGKPIQPLPEPPKAEGEDFELGGAL